MQIGIDHVAAYRVRTMYYAESTKALLSLAAEE